MPMLSFRVYVVQYDNGGGPHGRFPFHWRLVIHTGYEDGQAIGHAYYVSGSPALGYRFRISLNSHYKATSRYRGRVHVGTVYARDFAEVEYQLQCAEIRDREPGWSDQSWVYGAIRRLVAQRFQGMTYWSFEMLVDTLRAAEEAWERMED